MMNDKYKWAENELKLFYNINEDNNNSIEECSETEYFKHESYKLALTIYKCLIDNGYNNNVNIVNKELATNIEKLLNECPLTTIKNVDDEWCRTYCDSSDAINYISKRKAGLFKNVYKDGKVVYKDVRRVKCLNVHSGNTYYCKLVTDIIDEYFPIMFPYRTTINCYKVKTEEFANRELGISYYGILNVTTPECITYPINRFFKHDGSNNCYEEITKEEYKKFADECEFKTYEEIINEFNKKSTDEFGVKLSDD